MDFSSASGITTPLSSKQGDTQAKRKKVSPVAKYLQMPTISKTKTPPALSKNRAVTGARVLTSRSVPTNHQGEGEEKAA